MESWELNFARVCVFVPGGREKARRWADYKEDEDLDPLPDDWLEVAEEGGCNDGVTVEAHIVWQMRLL